MMNSLHQFFATLVFRDVTASSSAQNTLGVKRFVMHRDYTDRKSRTQRSDILDQLQPALVRKRNVSKYKIGFACVQGVECLGGIFGLAADVEIRLMIDEMDQPRTRHRVIVDDQYTSPFRHRVTSLH